MHTRRTLSHCAAARVAAIALAAVPRPAQAHKPAISLSPGSGPAGTSVSVSATGYDPNQDATVIVDNDDAASIHFDEQGNGSATITLPVDA